MSNKRKLRQRNGGKLTRDRQEWTHKKRLGHGSVALRPVASHNRASDHDRLAGVAARNASNGVQAVKGGQAIDYRKILLAALADSTRPSSESSTRPS